MHKHMIKDNGRRMRALRMEPKRIATKTHQNDGGVPVMLRNRHRTIPVRLCYARHRNRCVLTGRARGIHSMYFKTSRIMIRELASKGLLPGVKKASW